MLNCLYFVGHFFSLQWMLLYGWKAWKLHDDKNAFFLCITTIIFLQAWFINTSFEMVTWNRWTVFMIDPIYTWKTSVSEKGRKRQSTAFELYKEQLSREKERCQWVLEVWWPDGLYHSCPGRQSSGKEEQQKVRADASEKRVNVGDRGLSSFFWPLNHSSQHSNWISRPQLTLIVKHFTQQAFTVSASVSIKKPKGSLLECKT